jgi:hypothetical protein
MADLVNFIQIDGDKVTGNIASLSYDLDVTGEAIASDKPKAPVFRLFDKTPRGAGSRSAASGRRRTRATATIIPSRSAPVSPS